MQAAHKALRKLGHDVLVISGEEPGDDSVHFPKLEVVPGLNYRKTAFLSVADGLREALKSVANKHFGSQPDVWHFHNHSLGKNVLMPLVVAGLAEEKAHLLLQMHDFAEDGRAQNYVAQRTFFDLDKEFESSMYPRASHVHYATINQRDRNFLHAAGMKSEQVHLLANSVVGVSSQTTPSDRPFSKDKLFFLYPTRAIRRKNLGELLLLALANKDRADFATTLIPENPEWKPIHDQWVELAGELDLPIRFGIGNDYNFADLIGWADAHITTSVGEGFGLAFLEPWLAGKSVVGRNLPRITGDFSEYGISLDHLYNRIDVPLDWVDKRVLRQEAEDILRRMYLAYDCPLPRKAVELTFSRWIEDDRVDFGMLNESFQRMVIDKVVKDPAALSELNLPTLEPCSQATIDQQRQLVAEHYSESSYGENLIALYQKIVKASPGKVKSYAPKKVLAQFLDPWRLNLLRT